MKSLVLFLVSCSILTAQTFTAFVNRLEKSPVAERPARVAEFFTRHAVMPLIENDSTVDFIYYGQADTLLLNGNIQRWSRPDTMERIDCGGLSFFYRTYMLPPDARFDYQLIVDGRYQLDPRNTNVTPSGYGAHSELRMPAFHPTPYIVKHDSIPHGTIDEYPLRTLIPFPLSRYMLAGRVVKVYLPPEYDALSHLPTMYVHDGDEMINYALLPTIIDNMIADKKIVPIIAVFIPPVDRGREYVGDQSKAFISMICDELVPGIDKKYKTSHDPHDRAMMGISAGGSIALDAVFSRLDVFHNVAGQSSFITSSLLDLTGTRAYEGKLTPEIKIYLDCGLYDIRQPSSEWGFIDLLQLNRNFSRLLSSLHVPHYYREVNDGHEWASWRQRMPDILSFFFRK